MYRILLREIFKRFWKDRCFLNAQALTYDTVFALVPLLALGLSVIRLFIGTNDLLIEINKVLSQFLNPGALSKVRSTFLELIDRAQSAPLGAASMAVFVTMAVGLLMQFETTLNEIFRVRNSRGWLQRVTVYWMGLTLGPLLIALPLGTTLYLTHLGFKGMTLVASFSRFWTLIFVSALFLGTFLYLPAQKIRFVPALIGALCAGIIWFFMANLYAFYTSKAVTYSRIYGSLSTIPFFLLWLFINWSVVLFGAEITGVLHQKELIIAHYRYPKRQFLPLIGLASLLEIFIHHRKGLPGPREADLARKLKVSPFELEPILENLREAGIIFLFEERLFPARDADCILLQEIREALAGTLPPEPPEEVSLRVAYEFLNADCSGWQKLTLKDLLDRLETYKGASKECPPKE